ncbi:interleukin-17C [Ctenodactylus gundi]
MASQGSPEWSPPAAIQTPGTGSIPRTGSSFLLFRYKEPPGQDLCQLQHWDRRQVPLLQAMPTAGATATAVMVLPCILLVAWLPTSLAHQVSPFWEAPHTHGNPRCYSAEELSQGQLPPHLLARSAKWEQALPVALVPSLEAASHRRTHRNSPTGTQCPTLRPEQVLEADTHQRSISPWRYRIDTDEDRYPQKLAFAECLCRGCINTRTGQETAALNSVLLHQSLLVLRRRPCSRHSVGSPTPRAFSFHTEFIRVPVGCTCVLPRSSQ